MKQNNTLVDARYIIYNTIIPYDVWNKRYNVAISAMELYRDSLMNHIKSVVFYGTRFGVPRQQLELHDKSKWTKKEFPFYANRFHGTMVHNQEFISAINHHYANNKHHPEYWINGDLTYAPMPRIFILEMIADWHAASLQYTGSDNIQNWLDTKLNRNRFHPSSLDVLGKELRDIGYDL